MRLVPAPQLEFRLAHCGPPERPESRCIARCFLPGEDCRYAVEAEVRGVDRVGGADEGCQQLIEEDVDVL